MQLNWSTVFLFSSVAIVVLTIVISRIFRLEPQCPECGSKDIVETCREILSSRSIEFIGSGTPAGGNIRLQLNFELTYRCKNCNQTFKRKFTKTQ
jgi:transposase-like protein